MTEDVENNTDTDSSVSEDAAKEPEKLTESDFIGKVVEGIVSNVANFGAFVTLDHGESGLVHISEIANEFITDINAFVKVGDKVKVKILARNGKNKLELSIKQAKEKDVSEKVLFIHKKSKNSNFEDKLNSFLKKSEEKQVDIRRNLKNKQGISKKKR